MNMNFSVMNFDAIYDINLINGYLKLDVGIESDVGRSIVHAAENSIGILLKGIYAHVLSKLS